MFEKSFQGSTGDPPVPSGDSPDGTARAFRAHGGAVFSTWPPAVPVGGSPTRAGDSTALPSFKTRSKAAPVLNARVLFLALFFSALVGSVGGEEGTPRPIPEPKAVASTAKLPEPPPLPRRQIAPSTNAPPGEPIVLEDHGTNFTLFIPKSWSPATDGRAHLAVHFHTVPWFVIQEHVRRGAKEPLACFQLGEGSTVYRRAFEDTNRLGRVLGLVEAELKKRGAPPDTRITTLDISSFSAGYGAVRELVKSPTYFKQIERILLCDSLYAGFDSTAEKEHRRRPDPEHIRPWLPFAQAAARGEKTFLLTHSSVPTERYASTGECAAALVEAVGATPIKLAPGSLPAASDAEFPLRSRSDLGNFHVWGYDGQDAPAHLTHVRHLADLWMALDAVASPRPGQAAQPKAD